MNSLGLTRACPSSPPGVKASIDFEAARPAWPRRGRPRLLREEALGGSPELGVPLRQLLELPLDPLTTRLRLGLVSLERSDLGASAAQLVLHLKLRGKQVVVRLAHPRLECLRFCDVGAKQSPELHCLRLETPAPLLRPPPRFALFSGCLRLGPHLGLRLGGSVGGFESVEFALHLGPRLGRRFALVFQLSPGLGRRFALVLQLSPRLGCGLLLRLQLSFALGEYEALAVQLRLETLGVRGPLGHLGQVSALPFPLAAVPLRPLPKPRHLQAQPRQLHGRGLTIRLLFACAGRGRPVLWAHFLPVERLGASCASCAVLLLLELGGLELAGKEAHLTP
mmetsp:Transcript_2249/g.4803  ORF Transcript_2249/g.4803 Transcript_2249/m.4803 type:complete len:337 (-) Transcript_2249:1332-2342(-)